MKKYTHPLTKDLTPDNWKDKLNLDDLSVDDLIELLKDLRAMENFGKKLGGFLKEVIKVRCEGQEEYEGRKLWAFFKEGYREGGLDVELITEEMGEEWVENHRKEGTEFVTIKLQDKEA
jgi:hypothetical protein